MIHEFLLTKQKKGFQMNQIRLYRKRHIPNELIYLKDDIILLQSDDIIITKWNTLKPRQDISNGVSAYFLKNNYKVSKIYDKSGNVVYWYCDILNIEKNVEQNAIIFEDLLVDVIVYENGMVKVVDASELADALDHKIISVEMVTKSLRILDSLLSTIYSGKFDTLQIHINRAEQL